MSNTRLYFKAQAIREEGQFLCLTDMWRAAGDESRKRPSDWLALESTQQFREYLETTLPEGSLTRATEGRSGATWAHWQLAMAYAKYLSPEFHAWCNEVVRAVMQGGTVSGDAAALASLASSVERVARLAESAFALARDSTRRLDFIEQHVATGGRIPAPNLRQLKQDIKALIAVEVAAGKWPTGPRRKDPARAARADIYRDLSEVTGWGGKANPWDELPATLEPAVRAVIRRRVRAVRTTAPNLRLVEDPRQLTLKGH